MDLIKLLFFALACHTVAHTFTVMSIFKPVRQWANHKLGNFWSDLLTCPYCFGHHVAWVTVMLFNPFDLNPSPVLNFIVSWFSLTGATNFLTYILEERIKRPKDEKIIRYKLKRENQKIEV